MAIRKDINDFPFETDDREVWYFITEWDNKNTTDFTSRDSLVKYIKEILSKEDDDVSNYALFGVWRGSYRTDIFEIPVMVAYDKINYHINKPKPTDDTGINEYRINEEKEYGGIMYSAQWSNDGVQWWGINSDGSLYKNGNGHSGRDKQAEIDLIEKRKAYLLKQKSK